MLKRLVVTMVGRVMFLLLAIIAFGSMSPVHADDYTTVTGEKCFVCPGLSHATALIDENHGDCHDCCEISACSHSVELRPALVSEPPADQARIVRLGYSARTSERVSFAAAFNFAAKPAKCVPARGPPDRLV